MKYDGTDKYNGFWPAFLYLITIIPVVLFFCKVFYYFFDLFLQMPERETYHAGSLLENPGCIKIAWIWM